ncbi:MAG: phenylalanine--tRNA ligase subunit alpha [Paludibacteraceae bacterium]|nr:phenylalanine--tRNA ligase subunit alpha [Paludibacteraceae bacterium]
MLKDQIQSLLAQVEAMQASSAEEIEALRIQYLSKKGEITALFNDFRSVPSDQKRELGQLLNQLRQEAETRINAMREQIANSQQQTANSQLDLTRTPDPIALGTRHPLSLVKEEIINIFSRIGFTVAEGPEVEDDKHVYGMLNFAPEHPARDMQDTFFIEKEPGVQKPTDILLRSHTSSVQTRVMTSQKPPIRVLCPGRVYRNEAISARAHCFFHQVEGLYIDKNVSFADLREALLYFSKEMFGAETKIRLRPSYFPFTEPSAEMDISCNICGGTGCSFCKGTGWVEILGCGMVDPNVLESCGIDSKEYSGFAFGMGVERITNLKYRVKDLRLFSENDVRFLRQFESC